MDNLKEEYEVSKPKYDRLGFNVCEALKTFLDEQKISALSIEYRVKTYESFSEKISRKGYKNPFVDVEDFCGIRVIAYFPDDVEKIDQIIKSEFKVYNSEVKQEQLNDDQFGYRSDHFIVSIKDAWLATPNYRGLCDVKAEIQVRTVLMHAWADLSHKLAYKKKDSTPPQFLRNIYQLSALFELADEKFQSLRDQKEKNISSLVELAEKSETHQFPVDSPLNVDTLQAYLDYRFPNRYKDDDHKNNVSELVEELTRCSITLEKLDFYLKKCEKIIDEMEEITLPENRDFDKWSQIGMVRMILDHTDKSYMAFREVDVAGEEHMQVLELMKNA